MIPGTASIIRISDMLPRIVIFEDKIKALIDAKVVQLRPEQKKVSANMAIITMGHWKFQLAQLHYL